MGAHPLARLLREAAAGRPPPADGQVRVLPPLPGPAQAVVGFVAHHAVAAPVSVGEVDQALGAGETGAPLQTPFLAWLAQRIEATPGSVDVVLVAPRRPATPPLALVRRDDLANHPRVRRARALRADVEVYTDTDARGVLVVGRGLAGRPEVAVEVDDDHRDRGVARGLVAAAAGWAADGRWGSDPLFAQVAAANAAALRVFLAAGFRPIGAEALLLRQPGGDGP